MLKARYRIAIEDARIVCLIARFSLSLFQVGWRPLTKPLSEDHKRSLAALP